MVNPENMVSATLHASKPRHLPLGKLMDGCFQTVLHLLPRHMSRHIKSQILIFKTIIDKIVGRNARIEQTPHLVDHPLVKSGAQPAGYAFSPLLTSYSHTDNPSIDIGARHRSHCGIRMIFIICLYLYSTYGTSRGVHVGDVVKRLHRGQDFCQFAESLTPQKLPQFRIFRHLRKFKSINKRFDIESGASTHDRTPPAAAYVIYCGAGVAQIAKQIVFRPGGAYVEHMHRHFTVFTKILACAEIHAAINLTRIGADNLTADSTGKLNGATSLTARRRANQIYGIQSVQSSLELK